MILAAAASASPGTATPAHQPGRSDRGEWWRTSSSPTSATGSAVRRASSTLPQAIDTFLERLGSRGDHFGRVHSQEFVTNLYDMLEGTPSC